jgi:hypothetical protein
MACREQTLCLFINMILNSTDRNLATMKHQRKHKNFQLYRLI